MSRPSSMTCPPSGRRCPVIRLKKVDLPAPLGPITATICRVSTVRLTPATATKPAKDLLRLRISSTAWRKPMTELAISGDESAHDAAGEGIEQYQQDRAEDERPIFGIVGDLLVEPHQREGANRRAPEIVHAAEDGHDHDLGGFRPEDVVGENAAIEDTVERAREPG